MEIKVIEETGHKLAIYGNQLSMTKDPNQKFDDFNPNTKIHTVNNLAGKDGGHNNCLELITVGVEIKAPRYWWQEWDTYRAGIDDGEGYKWNVPKRSESTMHRLKNRDLTIEDFFTPSLEWLQKNNILLADACIANLSSTVEYLRYIILMYREGKISAKEATLACKVILPESFLQKRVIRMNYKNIRTIYKQRKYHLLPEWQVLIDEILNNIEKPEWITK